MTTTTAGRDEQGFAVLYVDDEEQALKYFRKGFGHEFPILTAPCVSQALAILEKEHGRVGVLLTDHRMPGQTGVELLGRVRQAWPNIVRILVTAYSDIGSAVEAVNTGAVYKYLTKPVDPTHLGQVLREAMSLFAEKRKRDVLLDEKMSVLQQMVVTDRVKSVAAMASGISHHLRNSMTAMNCYLEERDAAGAGTTGQETYFDELRRLATQEREQLARIVQSVGRHVEEPKLHIADEADLAELIRRAAREAAPEADERIFAIDVEPGVVTLKVDREATVRMLGKLFAHVARSAPPDGRVRVSVEAPVRHWNTTGVRILIRGTGPAWSDEEVASFFTPFAVSPSAPAEVGLDLLETFYIALGHGGDLVTHKANPSGPGFELRMPLDPASVRRPTIEDGQIAGTLGPPGTTAAGGAPRLSA